MGGRRLANRRSGDRAQTLGVPLLQAFCAVAPIPREEEFGIFDAIATLLRREGAFYFAEHSFAVEFKSRTVRRVEYLGPAFNALCVQELSVLIAQVNLQTSSIELHSLGSVFAHPNFLDAEGLIVHLKDHPSGLIDKILHARLTVPILRWTASQLEDRTFTELAYRVLKEHLEVERWNRRQGRSGISRQLRWNTNEVPTDGGEVQMVHPAREPAALAETVPALRVLALRAVRAAELRTPIKAIFAWLRGRGVEADTDGGLELMMDTEEANEILAAALVDHPTADIAVMFQVVEVRPNFLNFWAHHRDRTGSDAKRHWGTHGELRDLGFEIDIEVTGDTAAVGIGVTAGWLTQRRVRIVEETVDLPYILLQRLA